MGMFARMGVATVCVVIGMAAIAAADMYTWTDKDGSVHFSDTPPVDAKSKMIPSVKSRCSLRKYVVEFGEELVRKYVNHFGGPYMSNNRGNIPPKYYGVFDAVILEKEKCEKGDSLACKCVWNLSEPGNKSFVPTGDLIGDDLLHTKPVPQKKARP